MLPASTLLVVCGFSKPGALSQPFGSLGLFHQCLLRRWQHGRFRFRSCSISQGSSLASRVSDCERSCLSIAELKVEVEVIAAQARPAKEKAAPVRLFPRSLLPLWLVSLFA